MAPFFLFLAPWKALALKISHGDFFERIPYTQISLGENIQPNRDSWNISMKDWNISRQDWNISRQDWNIFGQDWNISRPDLHILGQLTADYWMIINGLFLVNLVEHFLGKLNKKYLHLY